MKILVAIAPERYRDEELDEPLAIFREQGIGFDIVSTKKGVCSGMLGGKTEAVLTFSEAKPDAYDALVIVGGGGSKVHLWGNRDLAGLATAFVAGKKPVAAICLSPVVLARTGILNGRKATVFPSPDAVTELKKGGAIVVGLPVVTDGNVITANGPEAAAAFGRAVISALTR
jgi:protease I